MMTKRPIFWLLALLPFAGCLHGCSHDAAAPPAAEQHEKSIATVTIYLLDGSYYEKLESHGAAAGEAAAMFRNWPVIERKRIDNPKLAKRLTDAIQNPKNFGGAGAACFWPFMGVAVGEGKDEIDAVICLECHWLYRYSPGGNEERLPLTEVGLQELKATFYEAFPRRAPAAPN